MGHSRGPNWFFGLMVSTKSKTTDVKEGDSTGEGPASNKKNRSHFMSPLCQTHMLDKLHAAIIRMSAYLIAIG
jgi:hypothetical protein